MLNSDTRPDNWREAFAEVCDDLLNDHEDSNRFQETLEAGFSEVYFHQSVTFNQLAHQNSKVAGRIIADKFCRQKGSKDFHFPQKSIHLPQCTDGSYAQTNSFNMPTFFYHYGDTLLNNVHEDRFEYSLAIEYAGVEFSVEVTDEFARVYEANANGSNDDIVKFVNPNFHDIAKTPGVSTTKPTAIPVTTFCLKNGEVCFNEVGKKVVPITLNGLILRSQPIKKAVILERNGTTEVILLFSSFFMATGTIEETKGRLMCVVNELPGTYGTTDFECSPDFTSMLRTCHVTSVKAKKRTSINEQKTDDVIKNRQGVLSKGIGELKKHANIELTSKNEAPLRAVCANLLVHSKLMESLDREEFHPNALDRSWTAREKLAYLLYKHRPPKHIDESEELMKIDVKECFERFIENASDFVHENVVFPVKGEVLAELLFQLQMATMATRLALGNYSFSGEAINMLILLSNFKNLYEWDLEDIEKSLRLLPSQRMKRTAVEAIAARATPSKSSKLLQLYDKGPVYEKIVQRAIRHHPYLILFGVKPLELPLNVLQNFSIWFTEELKQYPGLEVSNNCSQKRKTNTTAISSSRKRPAEEDFDEIETIAFKQPRIPGRMRLDASSLLLLTECDEREVSVLAELPRMPLAVPQYSINSPQTRRRDVFSSTLLDDLFKRR